MKSVDLVADDTMGLHPCSAKNKRKMKRLERSFDVGMEN
jgi:hypothetical protein